MERASWIDQLKLRASYGIAGVAAGKSGDLQRDDCGGAFG